VADGYTRRLTLGLAAHLHTAGIARYRDDTPYTAGELGIYTGGDFPLHLDRALVIIPGTFTRTEGRASGFTPMQILCRVGKGERITDLMDRLQDTLDRARPITLAGLPLRRIEFRSGTWFTADSLGRATSSQNFHLHGRRPS